MINAYYNGSFLPYQEVKIPLTDRSVFFADAIYEVMLAKANKIFQFEEHYERLRTNCRKISFALPFTQSELKEILQTITSENSNYSLVYVQLSSHSCTRIHTRDSNLVNILAFSQDINAPLIGENVRLRTERDSRYSFCDIKTTNLLPAVLSGISAYHLGVYETVYIRNGFVTECSHSALAILKNDAVISHPLNSHVLPSISCSNLMKAASKIGLQSQYKLFTFDDLLDSDEIFVLSTTSILKRASMVDCIEVGFRNEAATSRIIQELEEQLKII